LLVECDGPVAERDAIAEAGLPLDGALGRVHEDLGTLGAGVEVEGEGGETHAAAAVAVAVAVAALLDGEASLGLVLASLRCGGKCAA